MDPNYSSGNNYAGNVSSDAMAGTAMAIFGGFLLFALIFVLIIYVYMAVCLMKMAKKTGTNNTWMAWIPILNIILMLNIGKKPLWWIILFFIPLVNIVVSILVWMTIAKELGKPEWLGILMIIPIANLIIPGYLAFSDNASETIVPQQPSFM